MYVKINILSFHMNRNIIIIIRHLIIISYDLHDCFRNVRKEWCTKICLKIFTPSFFRTEVRIAYVTQYKFILNCKFFDILEIRVLIYYCICHVCLCTLHFNMNVYYYMRNCFTYTYTLYIMTFKWVLIYIYMCVCVYICIFIYFIFRFEFIRSFCVQSIRRQE